MAGAGLRLSVEYSDGRSTSTDDPWDEDAVSPPRPMVLSDISYGAGPPRATARYFLWPLPSYGSVTFCWSWPRMHLKEATHSLGAELFLDAAASCEQLWPPA
jgi:hypothetical protein